jgi:hypothetical protein
LQFSKRAEVVYLDAFIIEKMHFPHRGVTLDITVKRRSWAGQPLVLFCLRSRCKVSFLDRDRCFKTFWHKARGLSFETSLQKKEILKPYPDKLPMSMEVNNYNTFYPAIAQGRII